MRAAWRTHMRALSLCRRCESVVSISGALLKQSQAVADQAVLELRQARIDNGSLQVRTLKCTGRWCTVLILPSCSPGSRPQLKPLQ